MAILESLTSTVTDVGGVGGRGPLSDAPATASLHVKQVIAEAQRNLIDQLKQHLGGAVPHPLPLDKTTPTDDGCGVGKVGGTGRHFQTFDYGNQSNKQFEKVADEELERDYCQDWRTM